MSVNSDGQAGSFYVPACPGNCGNFGGGKPPPTVVTPMRHDVTLDYTEWKEPCYRTVLQGSGAKDAAVSGGGVEGYHGEGL